MNNTRILLGTFALVSLAGSANAQSLDVTGNGENFTVHYAPNHTGNILGGGFAMEAGAGQDSRILYAEPFISRRAPGIPSATGGEQGGVVYLPAASASLSLASR